MCNEHIEKDQIVVECEVCENQACFACSHIPEVLKPFAKAGTLSQNNVPWMCNCCKTGLPKLNEINITLQQNLPKLDMITEIQSTLLELKSTHDQRFSDLETRMDQFDEDIEHKIRDKFENEKPVMAREIETRINTTTHAAIKRKIEAEIPGIQQSIVNQVSTDIDKNIDQKINIAVEREVKKRFRETEAARPKPTSQIVSPKTQNKIVEISVTEQRDRESRQSNLIVRKLVEPISNFKDEMSVMDRDTFIDICQKMDVKLDKEQVVESRRLGQKRDDGIARALMITLKDPKTKGNIFKNYKNLQKTEYKDVKIANDLTKLQRENHQRLWEEAKRMSEADPSGKTYYRVVGPPWNWTFKKTERTEMEVQAMELGEAQANPTENK